MALATATIETTTVNHLSSMGETAPVARPRTAALISEQLAAGAHEMRTPLTALKAGLALMAEQESADNNDLLCLCRRNADRLIEVVNDLLDTARAEHTTPRPASLVRLDSAVNDVVQELAPLAGDQQVTLTAHVPDGLTVRIAEDDLRSVLGNLVGNALKFAPGGRVDITAEVADGDAVIRVRDDGIGIARDDQSKVFEPFVRAGRKPGALGSGLGLSIARALVARNEGSISVTSELGQGSCFTVALPLRKSAPPASAKRALLLP
jgi:two-component system, OmpR family, phosphate regulon sensor histidine kinase PhoR